MDLLVVRQFQVCQHERQHAIRELELWHKQEILSSRGNVEMEDRRLYNVVPIGLDRLVIIGQTFIHLQGLVVVKDVVNDLLL